MPGPGGDDGSGKESADGTDGLKKTRKLKWKWRGRAPSPPSHRTLDLDDGAGAARRRRAKSGNASSLSRAPRVMSASSDAVLTAVSGPSSLPALFRRSSLLIASDALERGELLASGGEGHVFRGVWLHTVDVAIKTIANLTDGAGKERDEAFTREVAMLSKLRHPHVLAMFGVGIDGQEVSLVTELVEDGDLASRMFAEALSVPRVTALARHLCSGMVFLHSEGIIHRDLKPENLLVDRFDDPRPVLKIADFGLAKLGGHSAAGTLSLSRTKRGGVFASAVYSAPELGTAGHSHKVDVFSFAVILLEMLTAERAFVEVAMSHQILAAVESGRRPSTARLSGERRASFLPLIERAWDAEPAARPEFSEIWDVLPSIPPLGD